MENDTPLRTREDAKLYFQQMGCSHFHMCREWPAKYDEYRRMGISSEQEIKWTVDACSETLGKLKAGALKPGELWQKHSELARLVEDGELWEMLEEVLEATLAIEERLPPRGRMLVAETIAGRQELQHRGGLIFQSHDSGRPALAAQFATVACRLTAGPFDSEEVRTRSQRALAMVAQIEKVCGLVKK